MGKILYNKNAFSLIEIITVVVIVGIMAGFAFSKYQKVLERMTEKDVIVRLLALSKAMEIYRVKHGTYPLPIKTFSDYNELKAILNTDLPQEPYDFSCRTLSTNDYVCYIHALDSSTPPKIRWTVGYQNSRTHDDSLDGPINAPFCYQGAIRPCPTCTQDGDTCD